MRVDRPQSVAVLPEIQAKRKDLHDLVPERPVAPEECVTETNSIPDPKKDSRAAGGGVEGDSFQRGDELPGLKIEGNGVVGVVFLDDDTNGGEDWLEDKGKSLWPGLQSEVQLICAFT